MECFYEREYFFRNRADQPDFAEAGPAGDAGPAHPGPLQHRGQLLRCEDS